MKAKRLLLAVLILMLAGSAAVFANDAMEWYKGRAVKVVVNGEPLKASGMLMTVNNESKTMLPVRDIAETLQAVVSWNEAAQTVEIFKPNVHIILSKAYKDGSIGTFGTVEYKSKHQFVIFVQIDSMVQRIKALKFEIVDPSQKIVYESEHLEQELRELMKRQGSVEDLLWINSPNISMEFKSVGKYKVKVYMKTDEKGEYFLVSEKAFHSTQK